MNGDIRSTEIKIDHTKKIPTYGDKVMTVTFIIVAMSLFVVLSFMGLGRSEVVECDQWQAQSQQYPAFYLVAWQKSQCDAHGIIINAPVK